MRTRTSRRSIRRCGAVAAVLLWAAPCPPALGEDKAAPVPPRDLSKLPANTWVLLDEVTGRGKRFARLLCAQGADRLVLWGFGGAMRDRATYARYELESFSPGEGCWIDALPAAKRRAWADGKWPPFRIYGMNGTDGPRIRSVTSMRASRVTFWDTDGVKRPSPAAVFNQCAYDARGRRVLFFVGGRTFALDPRTNTWSDLRPARRPTACATLAWGSLCVDPKRGRAVLFGGGLALNPEGGARTWIYDGAGNTWRRPKLDAEPPLRCCAPLVYDPASDAMVLFGGYDQAAALNDTWLFRCGENRWERRRPKIAPPPMFTPATAVVPGGGCVLVCGVNALTARRTHSRTRNVKETWVYDVAADTWRALAGELLLPNYTWLTAAGSRKHGVVFLVAHRGGSRGGDVRRTYALRFDPAGPTAKRRGAAPGTVRYKYPDQRDSLAAARPRTGDEATAFFRTLPVNTIVDADPPGLLVSKTWSSATFDTDRGEVVYAGGGHSGYSGNDVAHYHVGANRWTQSWPPRFPPFLESTNCSVFGWSYGCLPWSQHTYRWYAYDPVSKRVIYCARPAGPYDGDEVLLGDDPRDAFVYDRKKHGHLCWVYDPARRRLAGPSLHRPFEQTWCLALVGTPRGVYARPGGNDARLYHATVRDDRVTWRVADEACPKAARGYNYEWQPLVYDAKRRRLLLLMGRKNVVEVHARMLDAPGWTRLETTGRVELSREVVYCARQDALLSLGSAKMHVLDLASRRWRELDVTMPPGRYGTECAMVYDPACDVAVCLIPSRFSGPMKTYLLRYEAKTAKHKP